MRYETDTLGHFCLMAISLNQIIILIVNTYGYNSSNENNIFFENLEDRINTWLVKYPPALLLLGGDFNETMDNNLDRWPPRNYGPFNSNLKSFTERFDLVDIWREKFPHVRQYTWCNKDLSRQSRIDFWLISRCLADADLSVTIDPSPLTDHTAISITVSLISNSVLPPMKASLWKLNNSVLKFEKVQDKIKELISDFWNEASSKKSYGRYWELFKFELGKFLRKFGSDLAKKRRVAEENIIYLLTSFSQRENLPNEEMKEYLQLQNKLDDIYKIKAEGTFIRSRKRWMEEGEQNSSFFFSLEKINYNNSTINQLLINNNIVNDQREIATFCRNVYQNLLQISIF